MCPIWYEDELCIVYMMWLGISTYCMQKRLLVDHQKAYKQNESLDHYATILRQPKIFSYCIIQHISISKWDESCIIISRWILYQQKALFSISCLVINQAWIQVVFNPWTCWSLGSLEPNLNSFLSFVKGIYPQGIYIATYVHIYIYTYIYTYIYIYISSIYN